MKRYLYYLTALFICINNVHGQKIDYQEKHRPQFHFSQPAHWMNDPNGMVYYAGEYHLFYQYYPDATVWGPMHWGHAVSKDLIHWQHLPVALYPDSIGYIFSGSVVIDRHNSSGFQKGKEAPMVAIFTYHNMAGEKSKRIDFQTQGIAYSNDKGRTWTKYPNNPVIKNPGMRDFRDPKVSWHEASKQWVLTMAAGNQIMFYRSRNLINWELSGTFGKDEGNHGGVWECPDLFEMKTTDGKGSKWILLVSIGNGAPNGGSGTQYFVGNFDGKTFVNDNPKTAVHWIDYGTDNYAGVTWHNAPGQKRLFLGWMSNWQYAQTVPTKTWRSAMTLPRTLTLQQSANGYRIITSPVAEILGLRKNTAPAVMDAKKEYAFSLGELDLVFNHNPLTTADFGIELFNTQDETLRIGYDAAKKQFYINRTGLAEKSFSKEFSAIHTAPRADSGSVIKMHLYIDKSSVELFADDGSVVMTDIFFPGEPFTKLRTFENSGTSVLQSGKLYQLKSIWE